MTCGKGLKKSTCEAVKLSGMNKDKELRVETKGNRQL